MRTLRLVFTAVLLLPVAALAQNSETSWEQSYAMSGRPTLNLEVGDSSLDVHPCPSPCTAVHIRVTAEDTKLSLYNLQQSQSGNTVRFSLKEKPHVGFHVNWHNTARVRVEVETPAELTLDARTGDGSLALHDLRGEITATSSDGTQLLENLSGTLRLHGSDGGITVRRSSGTLEAKTSDGSLEVTEGKFSALQLHGANGSMRIELAEGSHLNEPSSIQLSDGSIALRLPGNFPANLDLHTSDGNIQSSLSLTVGALGSGSKHDLQAKLDGGGAPLSIRTSDGSIKLSH